MGADAVRAGPMPNPSIVTIGAPDDSPVLTITLASVKGRRFTTFRTVLLCVRRMGLAETNCDASAWSRALASAGASMTAADEPSTKEVLPSGCQFPAVAAC